MKTPSKREILVLTGHLCPKCDEFTELVESSEIYGTDFSTGARRVTHTSGATRGL